MRTTQLQIKRIIVITLLLLLAASVAIQNVSAEAPLAHAMQEDCVIPESGPWPPCATGGETGHTSNDDCIIPESGPWPPCATGGEGNNTPAPAPSSGEGCIIPESGPWPPCATDGSTNTQAPGTNASNEEINARISLALEQLQVYWQAELRTQGVNYRPPSRVVTYEGDPDDPPNAFYIPSMDAIFIDMRLLREITQDYGVYASVAVLAHEWAHYIQDQLNLLTQDRPLRRIELQADCFSGSFTRWLDNTGQLAPGEFEAGKQLFYSVGDDIIAPDEPYDTPGAHGTAVERQTAYVYGYDTNFVSCLSQYH